MPPSSAKPAGTARDRTRLVLVLGVLPLVAVLLTGAWVFWRTQESRREVQRAAMAEDQRRSYERVQEQLVQEEKTRQLEAALRHQDELRNRIPEVEARARDYLRRGDFALGLSLVDELLRQVESPDLLEAKVDLLNNAGRWSEAYLELQKLLRLRPDAAHLHLAAAGFARTLNGPKAALAHLDEAIRLEPNNTSYRIARANLCLRAGRVDQGVAAFEEMLAEDRDCVDCWYNYGDSLFAIGRHAQAVGVFRRAVDLFPDSSRHWFLLGMALDAWGREERDRPRQLEAAGCYRRSLELHPMPRSVAAHRILEITGQPVPAALEALATDTVVLEPWGTVYVVRVSINGVEGRFLLDTGASYTCVNRDAMRRFDLRATRRVAEVRIASNETIQAPVAYAPVRVGENTQQRATILILPKGRQDGLDGLLGSDFLKAFNGKIDVQNRRLILNGERREGLLAADAGTTAGPAR